MYCCVLGKEKIFFKKIQAEKNRLFVKISDKLGIIFFAGSALFIKICGRKLIKNNAGNCADTHKPNRPDFKPAQKEQRNNRNR